MTSAICCYLWSSVYRVPLFVLHVCMLRECVCARVTAVLVWGMDEVWLW